MRRRRFLLLAVLLASGPALAQHAPTVMEQAVDACDHHALGHPSWSGGPPDRSQGYDPVWAAQCNEVLHLYAHIQAAERSAAQLEYDAAVRARDAADRLAISKALGEQ